MMQAAASDYRQFVIFKLDNEVYGIETLKVRHIEEMMVITRVPGTPNYIKGVINLRGEIIPIIDLRKRFNLESVGSDENSRIMVLSIDDITAGVVVDEVSETLQISEENIEKLTVYSEDNLTEYVLGAAKDGSRVITLLDFEKLLKI